VSPGFGLRAHSSRVAWSGAIALIAAFLLIAVPAAAATWTVIPSPNATQFDNFLWGVDALSPGSAWAVGAADTGMVPTRRPVILRWNGTNWASTAVPMPSGGGELRDVDAVSSSDAWAVGFSNTSTGTNTLTERWNGSSWSAVSSPNVGAQNFLLAVKAFSATNAWAVGSQVQKWNGTSWSIVPAPSPDPSGNHLQAIDGVSSNDLWAVGFTQSDPYGVRQALILHFNGSSWSTVPTPPATEASLESVVALASNDVWAVGWEFSLELLWHVPYALHWNGSAWSEVAIPSPSPQGGRLFDVVALSPTRVYAVGHSNAGGGFPSLAMRWNGATWNVETTPSRSTVSYLWDATAASPSTIFAVGNGQQLRHGVLGPSRTVVVRTGNA
jgi:hypothetical protein